MKCSPRANWKMMMALLMAAAALLPACSPEVDQSTVRVEIGGQEYELEIAADAQARYQGLSDRKEIPPGTGMIFVFHGVQVRVFVMRRCLVPIDVIFLDPAGRIVAMHAMRLEPYDTPEDELTRYSSQWPSEFAIELAGGSIDQLQLRVGQMIDLPAEELRKLAQ